MPSCWIEINLAAITANFKAVQELVGEGVSIIAVVKANAYGHGAVEVSKALVKAGAPCLAVTRIEEAVPLREAGITAPILLLAPAPPDEVGEVVAHDLIACLGSYEDARLLSVAAQKQRKTVRAQLKVDTGMHRFGVPAHSAPATATHIAELPSIKLEAAFTHFAFAGGPMKDTPKVHLQFSQFQPLVRRLSHALSVPPNGFHCANSAALVRFPSMRLSTVRAGTVLYGQMPSAPTAESAQQQRLKLENTFQAKARVLVIREVERGDTVGYGGEWTAPRKSRIAVLGIGFADGFSQEPHTRKEAPVASIKKHARGIALDTARSFGLVGEEAARTVTIRNKHLPLVGRIAMQTCTVDVTQADDIAVGDEALISLRRTSAGAHLPRIYL